MIQRVLNRVLQTASNWSSRSVRFVLLELLGLFKAVRSAAPAPCCRFYPSCTQYAQEALRLHHPIGAIPMILGRLLRCHPFHPGGIDFVIPPSRA